MLRTFLVIALLSLCAVTAFAQQADTTATTVKQQADTAASRRTRPPQTTPPPPTHTTAADHAPARRTAKDDATRPDESILRRDGGLELRRLHSLQHRAVRGLQAETEAPRRRKSRLRVHRRRQLQSSHNYGGSLFSRLLVSPRIYAHGEFAYFSYKYELQRHRNRSILGAFPVPGRRSGPADGPERIGVRGGSVRRAAGRPVAVRGLGTLHQCRCRRRVLSGEPGRLSNPLIAGATLPIAAAASGARRVDPA